MRQLYSAVAMLVALGCGCHPVRKGVAPATEQDYLSLRAMFPVATQDIGPDTLLTGALTAVQVEIDALLLSSESRRWATTSDPESAVRIRAAWRRIIDSASSSPSGSLGWGLPYPWDAFGDGSVNPAGTPYAISTAQCIEALLDALDFSPDLFSFDEIATTEDVIKRTWSYWRVSAWTQYGETGWFWYSAVPVDSYDVVNVNGMMLAVTARMLQRQWAIDDITLTADLTECAIILVRTILFQAEYRNGSPYWRYVAIPNPLNALRANDAVHHVYIIWGIERARDAGLISSPPFSRSQALDSLRAFFRYGQPFDYPQDVTYAGEDVGFTTRPMILWGLGAVLAFFGEFGTPDDPVVLQAWAALRTEYGPFPSLRLWPESFSADSTFYPRYGAHVLWGIACLKYRTGLRFIGIAAH